MHPELTADPDDHDGGAAGWRADDDGNRGRLGDSPAARLCHRRRPGSVADPHALYDAGCLYLPRPAAELAVRGEEEADDLRRRRGTGRRMTEHRSHPQSRHQNWLPRIRMDRRRGSRNGLTTYADGPF